MIWLLLALGCLVTALAQPTLLLADRHESAEPPGAVAQAAPATTAIARRSRSSSPAPGAGYQEIAGLVEAPWAPLVRSTPTPSPTPEPTPEPEPTVEPTPAAPPLVPITGGWARVPILMYHYVRYAPDPNDRIGVGLSVTPEVFAAQMAYLKEAGYEAVTVARLSRALRGEEGLPPQAVVLTFDDGYADFYEVAWPILREHGFVSTLFVISGRVGQPGYVSREMLTELAASGLVEIGSHSVTHPDLTTLAPARLWREVAESKSALEEWTGQPVTSFCYPSGRYHSGAIEAVANAGYEAAVTTASGQDHTTEGALIWSRVRVEGPGSVEKFARSLRE